MKKHKLSEIARRFFLTVPVLALSLLLLWFNGLPIREYEPKPNQIDYVLVSEDISPAGISQSLKSNGYLRGIRVRWATHKTVPVNPFYAEAIPLGEEQPLERVEIPAAAIKDNTEMDIVFPQACAPGEYRIRLTCPPGSQDTVAVWESTSDSYREGSAFTQTGKDEGRDWSFHPLTAYPASMLIRHRIGKIVNYVFILLFCCASLAWIFGSERLKKAKRAEAALRFIKVHANQILIFLLVLIPTLAYLDFLTGERLYIFNMLDRGADSVGQTYANLLNSASRVRKGLWGELFNFQMGLGDAQAAFFPTLTSWVSLFGEARVAYLMGVSQWAKVVLSGIFAFLFIREYGAGAASRFVIALGYCFNSMLIARGAWESYPNIALLMILWMYAYERRLNGKGLLLFLFSTLFMFINLGLYDCVFYGALLPLYMLLRRIMKEQGKRGILLSFLRDLGLFSAFALLGMLDTVRYLLIKTLSSSRLTEGVDSYNEIAGNGFFSGADIWMSAFLRTVGLSINGILNHSGSLNLLEGPAFYTGVAVLLTAPVSVFLLRGKKKWIYLLLMAAAACYIAVVPLRLLANGFAKETFKLSSFWISLLILLLAAEFFCAMDRGVRSRLFLVLPGISAAVILFLMLLAKADGSVVSGNAWIVSFVLVILYLILLLLQFPNRRSAFVRFLLISCAIVEAMLLPYEMIHDRNMDTADENSWNDHAGTREIVASLPTNDWYRVEKDYVNVFLSDSLAEDYKGSASYVGGIEINQSVLSLYRDFNLPQRSNHYLFGSGGNIHFESLMGIRYLLARNDVPFRYGYTLRDTRNGVKIYENAYAYPLIYVSSDCLSAEELMPAYDLSRKQTGYEMQKGVYLFGRFPENSMLIIKADFDCDTRGTLYMQDLDSNFSSVYFRINAQTVIEIANDRIFSLWFDRNTNKALKSISFYLADQDAYYQTYKERALYARQNAVPFRTEGENRFVGTVSADEDEYIITAIPFDKKWKILLNGEAQETILVNGGLLGARIRKGDYQLDIRYDGDSWAEGNFFKILGMGAFLFTAVVIKLYKKRQKGVV